MIIDTYYTYKIDSLKRSWATLHFILQCDFCNKIFELCGLGKKRILSRNNFCCKECADQSKKPGGISHKKFRNTNIEKYGVTAPAKNETIRNKMKKTNLEKYGCECSFGNEQVQNKSLETFLERYGVKYASQIEGMNEKRAITNLERYGCVCAMNAPQIVAKYDLDAMMNKKYVTMKKNGTIGNYSSKPEQKLFTLLQTQFNINDIETQVKLPQSNKRWIFDFYIKSQNLWIQLDGIYWHGLNKELQLIKEMPGKHTNTIIKNFYRDREQEQWFQENNLHLLRITDKVILKLKELPEDLTSIAYFNC
jgi:hypothetical protein